MSGSAIKAVIDVGALVVGLFAFAYGLFGIAWGVALAIMERDD